MALSTPWAENMKTTPRFSHSGDRIAFMDNQRLVILDGKTLVEQLRTTQSPLSGLCGWNTPASLDWSPDDSHLMITAECGGVAIFKVADLTDNPGNPLSAKAFGRRITSTSQPVYARFAPSWTPQSGMVVATQGSWGRRYFFGTWETSTDTVRSIDNPLNGENACNLVPLASQIVVSSCSGWGHDQKLRVFDYELEPLMDVLNTRVKPGMGALSVVLDTRTVYLAGDVGIKSFSPQTGRQLAQSAAPQGTALGGLSRLLARLSA